MLNSNFTSAELQKLTLNPISPPATLSPASFSSSLLSLPPLPPTPQASTPARSPQLKLASPSSAPLLLGLSVASHTTDRTLCPLPPTPPSLLMPALAFLEAADPSPSAAVSYKV